MSDYEVRVTRLTVLPKGEDIFTERATNVEIADEAGGEFVVIWQSGEARIPVDPAEWPALRGAIDRMVKECRDHA